MSPKNSQLSIGYIHLWGIHPGGAKIVDHLGEALEL
jgi:predicted naringenin-chalcone synthase